MHHRKPGHAGLSCFYSMCTDQPFGDPILKNTSTQPAAGECDHLEQRTFPVGSRVYWKRGHRAELAGLESAAIVVSVADSNCEIEMRGRPGLLLDAVPGRINVPASTLRPRLEPCFAFGEPMSGHILGHCIEAVAVSDRKDPSSPIGMWEGRIEGFSVTLPCPDPDAAWRQAMRCLISGEYKRMLEAGIQKISSRRIGSWEHQVKQLRNYLDLAPQANEEESALENDASANELDDDL